MKLTTRNRFFCWLETRILLKFYIIVFTLLVAGCQQQDKSSGSAKSEEPDYAAARLLEGSTVKMVRTDVQSGSMECEFDTPLALESRISLAKEKASPLPHSNDLEFTSITNGTKVTIRLSKASTHLSIVPSSSARPNSWKDRSEFFRGLKPDFVGWDEVFVGVLQCAGTQRDADKVRSRAASDGFRESRWSKPSRLKLIRTSPEFTEQLEIDQESGADRCQISISIIPVTKAPD